MAHEERRTQPPPGYEKAGAHPGAHPPSYGQPHPSEQRSGFGLERVGGGVYHVRMPIRPVAGDHDVEDLERMAIYNCLYGALVLIIGIISIVLLSEFNVPIQQVLAWLLFASGVVGALTFLLMLGAPGGTSFLLLAILNLGTGSWLVFQPQSGILGVALIMSLWFIVHGIFKLIMTCQVRHVITWPAVLISGITSFVLAVLTLLLFPGKPAAQLGVIFGIDLVVTGVALFLISALAYMGKYGMTHAEEPLLTQETRGPLPGAVAPRPGQPPAGAPLPGVRPGASNV